MGLRERNAVGPCSSLPPSAMPSHKDKGVPSRSASEKRAEKEEPPQLPRSGRITDASTHKTYRLGRLLGKGGFAFCYEGTVEGGASNGERVAIKVIPRHRLTLKRHVEKVHREIRLHASVAHRNIVRLHSSFEDDLNIYILLELCARTLVEIVKTRGRLTEIEAAYYTREILQAMDYLYTTGVDILHRDVKLGNVLVTSGMEVKLADFGLASEMDPVSRRPPTISVCGTPNYISPEVLQKYGHSVASEMWALGCTLYAMLVGRPPFETSTIEETYALIADASYSLPSTLTREARDLVIRLLDLHPGRRPTPAQALSHDFLTKQPLPPFLLSSHCDRPLSQFEYEALVRGQYAPPSSTTASQNYTGYYSPPSVMPPAPLPRSATWAPTSVANRWDRPNTNERRGKAVHSSQPTPSRPQPVCWTPTPGAPRVLKPSVGASESGKLNTAASSFSLGLRLQLPPRQASSQPPPTTLAPLAKVESLASLCASEGQPPPLPPRNRSPCLPSQRQSYQAALKDPVVQMPSVAGEVVAGPRGSPTQGLGNGLLSRPPTAAATTAYIKPPRRSEAVSSSPVPSCLRGYLHSVQTLLALASSRKPENSANIGFVPVYADVSSLSIGGRRMRVVSRWIDYTNKYGFGVQLCDGSASVAFLDGSRLSYSACGQEMQFVDAESLASAMAGGEVGESRATLLSDGKPEARNFSPRFRLSRGDSGLGSSEELQQASPPGFRSQGILPQPLCPLIWPANLVRRLLLVHLMFQPPAFQERGGKNGRLSKELVEKVGILETFQNYMHSLLELNESSPKVSEEGAFLVHWSRMEDSVLLLLSDGTLQVNFLGDHRKLTLRRCGAEMGVVFVDTNGARLGARLIDLSKGPHPGGVEHTAAALDAPWRKSLRDVAALLHSQLKSST